MVMKMRATLLAVPASLWLTSAVALPLGDKDDAIKIAVNEWTGQHLTAHIAGRLLEKLGYTVEYETAGTLPQYTGLASGALSVSPEVWPSNVGMVYPKALAEGKLKEIGELGLQTRDGWVYTSDTKTVCPGLPDWKALQNPACAQALATPETFPNGRLLDYPADWGSASSRELENAGIPFTTVPAGSEGALIAELQAAAAAHKPLLMRFWTPHWILSQVPVEWLDMPPCDKSNLEECIVAPPVIKVVWSGFEAKWPAGYVLLKALQVNATDQQSMIYDVEKKGRSLDDAVTDWLAQHQTDWQTWIKAAES